MKFAVDKVEELIKQRVKELLNTRLQYLVRTLEFIDDFLWQILCTLYEHDLPAFCPRCQEKSSEDVQLVLRWGHEIRPDGKRDEAPAWICPLCGWYPDIFNRVDPKSLLWRSSDDADSALKGKAMPKRKPNGKTQPR